MLAEVEVGCGDRRNIMMWKWGEKEGRGAMGRGIVCVDRRCRVGKRMEVGEVRGG